MCHGMWASSSCSRTYRIGHGRCPRRLGLTHFVDDTRQVSSLSYAYSVHGAAAVLTRGFPARPTNACCGGRSWICWLCCRRPCVCSGSSPRRRQAVGGAEHRCRATCRAWKPGQRSWRRFARLWPPGVVPRPALVPAQVQVQVQVQVQALMLVASHQVRLATVHCAWA